MMTTPTKRRSLNQHKDYYSNVAPKVETRWPNDRVPLIRKGKFTTHKLIRRNSESCLAMPASNLLSPEPFIPHDIIEEEHDEGYTAASISLDESNEHNISTAMDISVHLDIVSGHFKSLFLQLESHLEHKAKTQAEKTFIEKHITDFKEHARQIDFMITELIERGERLEKFILNNDTNTHWAD